MIKAISVSMLALFIALAGGAPRSAHAQAVRGVDSVIARLEPLGIIEMVRTGQVAMRRGDVALSATQYS